MASKETTPLVTSSPVSQYDEIGRILHQAVLAIDRISLDAEDHKTGARLLTAAIHKAELELLLPVLYARQAQEINLAHQVDQLTPEQIADDPNLSVQRVVDVLRNLNRA